MITDENQLLNMEKEALVDIIKNLKNELEKKLMTS